MSLPLPIEHIVEAQRLLFVRGDTYSFEAQYNTPFHTCLLAKSLDRGLVLTQQPFECSLSPHHGWSKFSVYDVTEWDSWDFWDVNRSATSASTASPASATVANTPKRGRRDSIDELDRAFSIGMGISGYSTSNSSGSGSSSVCSTQSSPICVRTLTEGSRKRAWRQQSASVPVSPVKGVHPTAVQNISPERMRPRALKFATVD